MRETKHKVTRGITCLAELDEFLETTEKFSKKFYKVRIIHRETKVLRIAAIGISRDLVYMITWELEVEPLPGDDLDPAAMHAGDVPLKGWIPKDPDARKRLYPNYEAVPNAPGEHHWFSLFAMHGFKIVDVIEELED